MTKTSSNTANSSVMVDFRSDVVAKPTAAMLKAMMEAEVGDMLFKDDPTVDKLEAMVAEMLGKEAGLFVPSGTMGNLVCVLAHCWERGSEVLLGDNSHVFLKEQGGIAQFGGIHVRPVTNKPDGTFCLDEFRSKVQKKDTFFPITRLVCIENTHTLCGGRALPRKWVDELGQICSEMNLPIHCDGARLFNAATHYKVPAKDLVKVCDSVTVCLSKGLAVPFGSVLVGTKEFIHRAERLRFGLGGGFSIVGHIAAAGTFALSNHMSQLEKDHNNARRLADVISKQGGITVTTDYDEVSCNLLQMKFDCSVVSPEGFMERMEETPQSEIDALDGLSVKILLDSYSPSTCRLALHMDITDEKMDLTVAKLSLVLKELKNKAAKEA